MTPQGDETGTLPHPSVALASFAAERGIRYVLVSFTDLFGVQRAKLVPAQAITDPHVQRMGFAGFSTWLDMTSAQADLRVVPDPGSAMQLPWKPEVAWVASDCTLNGVPVAQGPRATLKRLVAAAAARGLAINTGVEAEFFLLTPDGSRVADPTDAGHKPCYDQGALMRRYDVIARICDAMLALGWGPYQNEHEDANGQFEINWTYADPLRTADRHAFFKFMVKSIAEEHGLRATFMPKPLAGPTGNGCHVHVSASRDGVGNVFADEAADLGLSAEGRHFLGGILRHARAMTAITNPTVNSYKRLNASHGEAGPIWSPQEITWSASRTHLLRVPEPGRLELRFPDAAANPYLLQAVVLAAGLDGLAAKADPGKPHDAHPDRKRHPVPGTPQLPLNLLDALRIYYGNEVLRTAMGEAFSAAYLKLRQADWNAYMLHLSSWETETTLDV